jgi:hypothetical protein
MGPVRPRELPDEPRFAHAGLTHEGHRLPMSSGGVFERLGQLLQLPFAPDEARQAACGAGLEPRPRGDAANQLVDVRRSVESLHGDRAERPDLDKVLGQTQGVTGDERGPGFCNLLHPGGKMGRLPDSGVIHVEVAADGADDHLAGIEPHADLHWRAALALSLVRVKVHPPLHPQRRIARADRVVLVSQRCPEQRHDPVAHHLVDGAFVVMDRLDHPL